MRKVAEWLIENEEEYVVSRDARTLEDNQSQAFLEGGLCMIKNCLELIETHAGKQRFSLEGLKSVSPPQEKPGRNNTFTQ